MPQGPDYGIDSPAIIAGEAILAVVFLGVAALPHLWLPSFRWLALIIGIYLTQAAVSMIYYSKRGKLKLRDQLLERIPWRGDEIVLDIGCGRGLLLAGAAKRLTSGRVIGVDVWLPGALTGNSPAAALQNAKLEGIADRVEVQQSDARELSFGDSSFDVVVSNFVLHELSTAAEREKMTCELLRVLKPGGHLALIDFIFTRQCVETLRANGMADALRSRLGSAISFWISALLTFGALQVYLVTGHKDLNPSADLHR